MFDWTKLIYEIHDSNTGERARVTLEEINIGTGVSRSSIVEEITTDLHDGWGSDDLKEDGVTLTSVEPSSVETWLVVDIPNEQVFGPFRSRDDATAWAKADQPNDREWKAPMEDNEFYVVALTSPMEM